MGTVNEVASQAPGTSQFNVDGSYTYPDLGEHAVSVDVYDDGGSFVSTGGATINVTDGTLTTTAENVAVDELTAGDVVKVAHVMAQNPAAVSAEFSVTTAWGDGNVDHNGFVVPTPDGGFNVYATKTTDYAGSSAVDRGHDPGGPPQ